MTAGAQCAHHEGRGPVCIHRMKRARGGSAPPPSGIPKVAQGTSAQPPPHVMAHTTRTGRSHRSQRHIRVHRRTSHSQTRAHEPTGPRSGKGHSQCLGMRGGGAPQRIPVKLISYKEKHKGERTQQFPSPKFPQTNRARSLDGCGISTGQHRPAWMHKCNQTQLV